MANLLEKLASGLQRTRNISAAIDTLLGASDAAAARNAIGAYGPSAGEFKQIQRKLSLPNGLWTDDHGWLWLPARGDSIGSAASTAEVADDRLEELFKVLWQFTGDGVGFSSSGSDPSAQAAWDANEVLTVPDRRGRVAAMAGQGPGLSNRTQGDAWGEEEHTQSISEMPEHNHVLQVESVASSAAESSGGGILATDRGPLGRLAAGITPIDLDSAIQDTGDGDPFNVTQPSFSVEFLYALGVRA